MDKWSKFYRNRVNSNYQTYFEKRYEPFLRFIQEQNNNTIIEMGCGIGSISKFLLKKEFNCKGFDLSSNMVKLANQNVGIDIFTLGNIFAEHIPINVIGVSHGVLEHFSDEDILKICKGKKNSIHYVPLDKYITPSFGDERLLPYEHWVELLNPQEYQLFNNNHDLMFKL